jgi:hypothetical protein
VCVNIGSVVVLVAWENSVNVSATYIIVYCIMTRASRPKLSPLCLLECWRNQTQPQRGTDPQRAELGVKKTFLCCASLVRLHKFINALRWIGHVARMKEIGRDYRIQLKAKLKS